MDLNDLHTRLEKDFQWILHCGDHYSKYSWVYPLRSKEAEVIADHLTSLFYQFGPCKILQSDNGREFTDNVVKNLKNIFPGLIIINGRTRSYLAKNLDLIRNCGNLFMCKVKFFSFCKMNENDFVILDILNEEDLLQSILQCLAEEEASQPTLSKSPNVDTNDQQGTSSSIITTNDSLDLTGLSLFNLTPPPISISSRVDIKSHRSECSSDSIDDGNNYQSQQTNEGIDFGMELSNSRHSKFRKRATETYLYNAKKKKI